MRSLNDPVGWSTKQTSEELLYVVRQECLCIQQRVLIVQIHMTLYFPHSC